MPANYAHYFYGELIKEKLKDSKEIYPLIHNNLNEFEIGLHGPDVLFYCNPFKKNAINTYGNDLHDKKALDFFINAKETYLNSTHTDAELAFLFGFLCHYVLDMNCHPLVEKYIDIEKASHYEIESSLDRHILKLNNKNPLKENLTKHFIYKEQTAKILAKYFNISFKDAKKSIKEMKLIGKVIVLPHKFQRKIVNSLLKLLKAESFNNILVPFTDNLKCKESNEVITKKMYESVDEGKDLIINYYHYIKDNSSLNMEELSKNYLGIKIE